MLLETLGLVGGAVARLLPTVLEFFKQGRDLKYEVLRMDKEAELEKLRGLNKNEEIAAAGSVAVDDKWAAGLVEALKAEGNRPLSGFPLLDWLSSSVRPMLTYWWCIGLYSAHKAFIVYSAILENLSAKEMAQVILTDFDRAVVGSIIGFWFVDRALRKGK